MTANKAEGIRYPYSEPPKKGEWIEVAQGVYWLQMALPMALDHINLYVIEDDQGWWIVDTGMKWGDTQERWQLLFDGPMQGKPLLGVICTHLHPDHIGQAGWLCKTWKVPLCMSIGEYLSARTMTAPAPNGEPNWALIQHFIRSGIPEQTVQQMASKFQGFGDIVEPLPRSYRRLRDGQTLSIGGREWQVMIGSGHSPEHVCLYDARDHILLSGDQIIPRITSNVSVMPTEPEANPLVDWFNSLRRFRAELPEDTLILPAHNAPFYGAHYRLEHLIAHHESHLAAIEKACAEQPKTALELFPVLFEREVGVHEMPLALGEAVAHLHYLYELGRLERELHEDGAYRYHSVDLEHCPYTQTEAGSPLPIEV
ncbi:MBL fold metallo-hydrolase [Spongiibacter sp. KMU-158]|uniref:MBL fold metallo-hydrolase n=1 Tax=Spongiibacter pelagi TaxID=2760804 RepID=A0A927C515_9GAMM|nr:MBL fold metallo-hydrolase [Spongiibacter pelagi]MBD2859881.1 MBL fold metallo-hydrolase [Spongiibacter pelagi]